MTLTTTGDETDNSSDGQRCVPVSIAALDSTLFADGLSSSTFLNTEFNESTSGRAITSSTSWTVSSFMGKTTESLPTHGEVDGIKTV